MNVDEKKYFTPSDTMVKEEMIEVTPYLKLPTHEDLLQNKKISGHNGLGKIYDIAESDTMNSMQSGLNGFENPNS